MTVDRTSASSTTSPPRARRAAPAARRADGPRARDGRQQRQQAVNETRVGAQADRGRQTLTRTAASRADYTECSAVSAASSRPGSPPASSPTSPYTRACRTTRSGSQGTGLLRPGPAAGPVRRIAEVAGLMDRAQQTFTPVGLDAARPRSRRTSPTATTTGSSRATRREPAKSRGSPRLLQGRVRAPQLPTSDRS